MFNVIRIPTKFSRPIKRLSDKEKLKLLDALINIGDGIVVRQTDDTAGDLLSLIYGEWMNMESKNGYKKDTEYVITTSPSNTPSMSGYRVEENRIEYNRIEENTNVGEQALDLVKDFGNKDINELLESIKGQVEFLGLIYKKGKYERERAKNILTGKEFGKVCEKANMSRIEFCKSIIYTSSLLTFWNGKINNAETLYEHYAKVYNDAVNKKSEMARPKESALDITL